MYFTNLISETIQRANVDGSGAIEDLITTGLTYPYGIAVDSTGGKFYWADTDKIHRADLDGTNGEDLVTGLTDARGVELDLSAGKVYCVVVVPAASPKGLIILFLLVVTASIVVPLWRGRPAIER
jgi:DNA-binding beta-propeller fold protein YncE